MPLKREKRKIDRQCNIRRRNKTNGMRRMKKYKHERKKKEKDRNKRNN